MKRSAFAFALLLVVGSATAKDPVPVGDGVYMLTDRNITIFGSSDGIVAKLMTRANTYCLDRTGGEAEMVNSRGSEAAPGELNKGQLVRAATGASGTVYFRCEGDSVKASSTMMSRGRYLRLRDLGVVMVQVTLPDVNACAAMLATIGGQGNFCAPDSVSDELPIRAIVEEIESNELYVVESTVETTCSEFVRGFIGTSGMSILQPCKAK